MVRAVWSQPPPGAAGTKDLDLRCVLRRSTPAAGRPPARRRRHGGHQECASAQHVIPPKSRRLLAPSRRAWLPGTFNQTHGVLSQFCQAKRYSARQNGCVAANCPRPSPTLQGFAERVTRNRAFRNRRSADGRRSCARPGDLNSECIHDRRPFAQPCRNRRPYRALQEYDPAPRRLIDSWPVAGTAGRWPLPSGSGRVPSGRHLPALLCQCRRVAAGNARSVRAELGKRRLLCAGRRDAHLPLPNRIQAPIRYMVREGDVLPLRAGSGGRVLAAFSGAEGEPYETIRRTYHFVSIGDRDPETAGVSAPVFGPGRALIGVLTLAGPRPRVDPRLPPSHEAAAARSCGAGDTWFRRGCLGNRGRGAPGCRGRLTPAERKKDQAAVRVAPRASATMARAIASATKLGPSPSFRRRRTRRQAARECDARDHRRQPSSRSCARRRR